MIKSAIYTWLKPGDDCGLGLVVFCGVRYDMLLSTGCCCNNKQYTLISDH